MLTDGQTAPCHNMGHRILGIRKYFGIRKCFCFRFHHQFAIGSFFLFFVVVFFFFCFFVVFFFVR